MAQRVSLIEAAALDSGATFHDYELQAFERHFLLEGVIQPAAGNLAVEEHGAGANMSVDVQIGTALIEITNTNTDGETYLVYFLNDDIEVLPITTADPTNPRIDRVIAEVLVNADPNASASNIAVLRVVAGTPAGSPAAPALPANSISLATVSVPASDTTIATAQITDARVSVETKPEVLLELARLEDLASTSSGKGASLIGVEDSAADFAGDNVEEVLAELQAEIEVIQASGTEDKYGDGSDGALNVTSGTTTINLGGANIVIKQYTSINVSSGATLAFSNPAADGTIIIFRCTGNVTFAGTVDVRNLGATGNTSPGSVSSSSAQANGGDGTNAYNNLGQTRNGGLGTGHGISTSSESAASGGGGAASTFASGTASAVATAGSASAAAGTAGVGITAGLVGVTVGGIFIAPGAGGASGGAACNIVVGTQPTATGGVGGRGAGSLIVICKGDYSDAGGVINLAGTDGAAGSKTNGTTEYSVAYGGGGGGAGGIYLALVKGTITMSGTRTITGGSGGGGGNASAGGQSAASSSGGNAAAGYAAVLPILL